jgi:hypothetical protein
MLFFDDFINVVSIMCMWSKADLLQGSSAGQPQAVIVAHM